MATPDQAVSILDLAEKGLPGMGSTCAAVAPFVGWPGHVESQSRAAEDLLIESTLQGQADAFGYLVQPYLPRLTRLARARLGSAFEAEDVVQQSVLRAFSHLRQFRREASFKTWLSAIASNEVSHLRRDQAAASVQPLHEARAENLADPSNAPDVQAQRRQEVERLHRALTCLPEKYRVLIQLRDLREMSVAETAESLSMTAGAVRTRHHRARKLLVRSLAGARRVV